MADIPATGAGTESDTIGIGAGVEVTETSITNVLFIRTTKEEIMSFSSDTYNTLEDAGVLTIALFRINPRARNSVQIQMTTIPGTAASGVNYIAPSGTVTFAAFQTLALINITINNTHFGAGATKTFSVKLSIPPSVDAWSKGPNFQSVITINGVA